MTKTVFLAGASGVIGSRLVPILCTAGWRVIGTTRDAEKVSFLKSLGAEVVIVDAFNLERLSQVMKESTPSVVVHQLTDLPPVVTQEALAEAVVRTARLRDEGTRNLLLSAKAAGVARFIAQSVGFVYEHGEMPFAESAPLCVNDPGWAGITARGITSLEQQVLSAPLAGIILRYGRLYGPGTWFEVPTGPLRYMLTTPFTLQLWL